MTTDDVSRWPALEALAQRYGVSTDYWDWQGAHVPVSVATVQAVLATFGVTATTDAEVAAALASYDDRPWQRLLGPVTVMRAGEESTLLVHVRHGDPVEVSVVTEAGESRVLSQREHNVPSHTVTLDGGPAGAAVEFGEAAFALPADLAPGYHRITATSGDRTADSMLVVAPHRLELPAALAEQSWGVMAQLYSARSRGSWGIGDFRDLADLAAWSAGLGAEFLLVNPLHAAEAVPPMQNSPYLPTTRRFVNPLYLRIDDIPEVASLATTPAAIVDKYAAQARAGDESPTNCDSDGLLLLDRQRVWTAKLGALDAIFHAGRTPARQRAFDAFRASEGAPLDQFALWCALDELVTETDGPDAPWPDWAVTADAETLAELSDDLADRIDFFAWLQWLCDAQLAAAQAAAIQAGMNIGIVTDLAVGVHPTGADVWSLGEVLATGVDVGAPPDAFNQIGQNWSQPPWRPDQLAEAGYAPYIAMLRTVLRHAGALRIDHVMGLFRLWCIPHGRPADEGAYLRYDHEAMVSILLLEAHRAGAFVVGEDLGVVEPWVRDYLADRGILGTSILWFETEGGAPRPPESYRRLCLATVATHDLPPTAGYLAGVHVALRTQLGLLTRSAAEEYAAFEAERDAYLALLRERGLIDVDAGEQQIVEALHALLTATPSRLLGVMLPDLVGDRRTQNQPGTDQEYPNWRIPLSGPDGSPVWLDNLRDPDSPAHARAHSLAARLSRGS